MQGLYRVYSENGSKKLQAFMGTELPMFPSVPVGAIIPMYTTTVPSGYLPCNGAEYDTDQFPMLFAVLGTNKLPDLRECVLVGAGTNETDAIATHDVYTINEFKDDQVQTHGHTQAGAWSSFDSGYYQCVGLGSGATFTLNASSITGQRTGTTTHGKQKGVFFVIKATMNVEDIDNNTEFTQAINTAVANIQTQADALFRTYKQYVQDQNELDETNEWQMLVDATNLNTAVQMPYDGYVSFTVPYNQYKTIYAYDADRTTKRIHQTINSKSVTSVPAQIYVKKGWWVYLGESGTVDESHCTLYFYKKRDYTGR